MQKTYWWRILAFLLSSITLVIGFVYEKYYCFSINERYCPLDYLRLVFFEPVIILTVSVFIVSIILFFIQDTIFIKWLKFAIGWFVIAAILIAIAPVYSGGFVGFGPTKESVSIWMSSLFVLLSLILIVRESKKAKN